jgi:hypothetical protein
MKTVLSAFALSAAATCALAQTSSSADLAGRTIERRAVEAAIWGMPAVNYDLMLQEMLTKTPGKVGQVIYWGRPLDWHNQTLTPNPDALYFMVFFNTKDGPVLLDLPPADNNGSFNGNIVTVWQMPLEDAGLLGYDKGAGGRYLILPPGYKGGHSRATSRCHPTRSAGTCCSAPTSRAIATRTFRLRSPTARG